VYSPIAFTVALPLKCSQKRVALAKVQVNASNVCTFALSKTCRVGLGEAMCARLLFGQKHHSKRIHFPIVFAAEPIPAVGTVVDASRVVSSVVVGCGFNFKISK
jgi:hypothetical protein